MNLNKLAELKEMCPPELFEDMSPYLVDTEYLEICQRAARYATMLQVTPSLPFTKNHMVRMTRERVTHSFEKTVINEWSSSTTSQNGLCAGDLELAADELGVYEVIWPFDQSEIYNLGQEPVFETA